MPKEMTPFGAKKAKPFGGGKPFGGAAPKANPFAEKDAKKGKKPFGFAGGGEVAKDTPTHMAATNSNPPSKNALDDGKPSGGGIARGGGAATKGKRFQGTF
jgi:hypothetical protein